MTTPVTLAFLNTLAPLRLVPDDQWVGQIVYHAGAGQSGPTPFWRFCDEEPWMRRVRFDPDEDPADEEPDWEALVYDRGVVREVTDGPWGPEYERSVLFHPDVCQGRVCNCDCSPDFCLNYTECALWVDLPFEDRVDLVGLYIDAGYREWLLMVPQAVMSRVAGPNQEALVQAWGEPDATVEAAGIPRSIWRRATGAFVIADGAGTLIEAPFTMDTSHRIRAALDLIDAVMPDDQWAATQKLEPSA